MKQSKQKKSIFKLTCLILFAFMFLAVSCLTAVFSMKGNSVSRRNVFATTGEVNKFNDLEAPVATSDTGAQESVKSAGANLKAPEVGTVGVTTTLPEAPVSGETWQDSFKGLNADALKALPLGSGNFFKRTDNGKKHTGSKNDKYVISKPVELAFLGAVIALRGASYNDITGLEVNDKYFKLSADIDLSGKIWTPLVDIRLSNTGLNLDFDGNDKTISNVYVDKSADSLDANSVASIFGCWYNGSIENLTIENSHIIGNYRASVVANACANNYCPVRFENIIIKNCKVESNRYSTGISDNAEYIKNCKVENSEIIVREIAKDNIINDDGDRYVLGLGRANVITYTGVQGDALLNSIVKYDYTFDNYDTLTGNRTHNHYVAGIGISRNNEQVDISNMKVTNSQILHNLHVNSAKKDVEGTNYSLSFNNYIAGAYWTSINPSGSATLAGLTVDNCEVKSTWSYNPTSNKNIRPYINDSIVGVGKLYNSGRLDDAPAPYNFYNLKVNKTTIESNGQATILVPASNPETSYKNISFSGDVYGIFDTSSSNLTASGCELTSSSINLERNTNLCKENNFYTYQNLCAYGAGTNKFIENFGSKVEGSKITVTNNMYSQGDSDPDKDFENVTQTRTRIVGIGRGRFNKTQDSNPCTITNSIFTANSQSKRDEGDKSSNHYTDAEIVGLGYLDDSKESALFDGCLVSGNTFTATSALGTSYITGMGKNWNWGMEYVYTAGCEVTNNKFVADGVYSRVYGLSYNASYLKGQEGATPETNATKIGEAGKDSVKVINNDITATARKDIQVVGVSYNPNYSAGIELQNIELKQLKVNAVSDVEGSAYVFGLSWNASSLYYTSVSPYYFNYSIKDVTIESLDMTARVKNNVYMTGGDYNTSQKGHYSLNNVNISKSKMLAVSERGICYLAGLTYNGKSIDENGEDSVVLKDCHADNLDIYATSTDKVKLNSINDDFTTQSADYENTRSSCRTAGLMIAYNSVSNNVINSSVRNSRIKAFGTGSSMNVATGMVLEFGNNANKPTEYKNNIVENCDIIATSGLGDYSSPSGAYSAGMILNNDSKTILVENCEVKNSNVCSKSSVSTTEASGVLLHRSQKLATIKNSYAVANYVHSEFISGGNGASVNSLASGLASSYLKEVNACVVTDGSVIAKNSVGKAFANGVAATWYASNDYYRPEGSTIEAVTKIVDSYNFANVSATTTSTNNSYAAGVGQAEYFDSCFNYGEVQGNYAGGISYGFYRSYNPGERYSIPLTIKNSVNAGNIYRAPAGQRSYIGGIVAMYQMLAPQYASLILENNVSVGGVYSSKESDGTFKQELSSQTYLGLLYGYLNFNTVDGFISASDMQLGMDSPAYKNHISKFSIKNNSVLVDENGINANLKYSIVGGDENFMPYSANTPERNYFATSHGVFYSNGNTSNAGTYKDMFKQIYLDMTAFNTSGEERTLTNAEITTGYNESNINYSRLANEAYTQYATEQGWKEFVIGNNIAPQVKTSIQRKIVIFDLNGIEGKIPHITLVVNGDLLIPDSKPKETGISVDGWASSANGLKEHNPGQTVNINPVAGNSNLVMMTMYAKYTFTEYTVKILTHDENDIFTVDPNEFVITLNNKDKDITVTYTSDTYSPKSITWLVQVKDSEEVVKLAFETYAAGSSNIFNLNSYFTSEFIDKYATSTKEIIIKVDYDVSDIFTFTITDVSGLEKPYDFSVTTSDGKTIINPESDGTYKVVANTQVSVTANPHRHYDFVDIVGEKVGVGSEEGLQANKFIATINQNLGNFNINVKKHKYSINVELQNKQLQILSGALIPQLTTGLTETKISIGEDLPQLKAITTNSNYRFVGWRFFGSNEDEFIPVTAENKGQIATGIKILPADFDRYVKDDAFRIIGVFQKQYTLTINMNNPEGYLSKYEISYKDENGNEIKATNVRTETVMIPVQKPKLDENGEQEINPETNEPEYIIEMVPKTTTVIDSTGSYIIDENTFITITLNPNKRVSVTKPENVDFFDGKNALVILNENKAINFVFDIRPLTVKFETMNVLIPEEFREVFEKSLNSVIDYSVVRDGQVQNNPDNVNINDELTFSFDKETLGYSRYRGINMYLKNITNKETDLSKSYNLIEDSLLVDDNFFENYVNDDGTFTIMLKVIKQHTVSVVGNNLVTKDGFNIGSFEVVIKDGDDVASAERYKSLDDEDTKPNVKNYLVDYGLKVVIIPKEESKYASFTAYEGSFETEVPNGNNVLEIIVEQNRPISLRFDKNTYAITSNFNAAVGGEVNATKKFQLGDTISFSYTPENNYQILGWKIAGKNLAELGGTLDGNTVNIAINEETLDTMLSLNLLNLEEGKLIITSNIDTMMNPTLFYGLIIGAVVILLLAGLLTFLLIRQGKLKKQKAEQERKLNDIARKFNIAGLVSDLKAGKDVDFGQDKSNTKKKK